MRRIFIISVIVYFASLLAYAQTVQLLAPEEIKCGPQPNGNYKLCEEIPGFPLEVGGIADFIGVLFRYSLMIGGIVVFLRIIYGGLMYIFSGGNPGKQNDARDVIWQAIWGLGLLLGSYLILNTINPALVTLRDLPSAVSVDLLKIPEGVDLLEAAFKQSQKDLSDARTTLKAIGSEVDQLTERKNSGEDFSDKDRARLDELTKIRNDKEEVVLDQARDNASKEIASVDSQIDAINKKVGQYEKENIGFFGRLRRGVITTDAEVEAAERAALENLPSEDPKYGNEYDRLLALRQQQEAARNVGASAIQIRLQEGINRLREEAAPLEELRKKRGLTPEEQSRLENIHVQMRNIQMGPENPIRPQKIDRRGVIYGQP